MNKTRLAAIAGMALLAAASAAWSQGYLGVALGNSKVRNPCEGAPSTLSCDGKDSAVKIFGGYQVARSFAFELGFNDLGSASASGGETVKLSALELSAIGSLPLAGRFALHGRFGLHHGESEASGGGPVPVPFGAPQPPRRDWQSGSKIGPTFGLGASFDIADNAGLRIEWQRFHQVGAAGRRPAFGRRAVPLPLSCSRQRCGAGSAWQRAPASSRTEFRTTSVIILTASHASPAGEPILRT